MMTAQLEKMGIHQVSDSSSSASHWYIGCAGWSLPSAASQAFPAEGTHLQRYASVLSAVEINSSFYRPHRPQTYARWRDSVPDGFRFSVKVPKTITHISRLRDTGALIERFAGEVGQLEEKLGCLLVQLPPSLRFDPVCAERFFAELHGALQTKVVCEPRHASWFGAEAASLLGAFNISYVRADPPTGTPPDLETDLLYIRLHGSPVMYYSNYEEETLLNLAAELGRQEQSGSEIWCIFDNTAEGFAVPNALSMLACERQVRAAYGDIPPPATQGDARIFPQRL